MLAYPARCEEWSKTFPVSAPAEFRLEAGDTNVSIAAWDREEIAAKVTTVGWKISNREVRVLENHASNLLELEVVAPKPGLTFGKRSVKIEIQVPRETGTEVRAGLGWISIQGVKGKIVLESRSGHLDALDLDGKLEASTGEGKIHARGRFDLLTLRTGFGAIDAMALPGSHMFSVWRVNSDDGTVTLHLPTGFAADLDAKTESGKITVDLPYTLTGTGDPSEMKCKMNGGGEALVLRTSGGNIKVLNK